MNNKTASITVRLTKEQKEIVEKAAKDAGVTVSDFTIAALINKSGSKELSGVKESDSSSGFSNIDIMLTKELELKVIKMAEELGATKQECIRRLISEGKIYDLRINIDMTEEFMALTSEINNLNRMANNIYTVCKRVDGVLTKHEVDHLYEVMHEIRDSSNKILASIYKTNGQLKIMARKRMEKLIKEKVEKAGD